MRALIVASLSAALCLVPLAWALDLYRLAGLYLFGEQVLMAMLMLAVPLSFLTRTLRGESRSEATPVPVYDGAAALAAFVAAAYVMVQYGRIFETLYERPLDATIAGVILIALTVEGLRRTTGNMLAIVVLVFLVYGLVGHLVPGELQGRRVAFDRLAVYLSIDSNGMPGMPLMVTVTAVVMFVLFGSFLTRAGGGQFFTDLSMAGMGRYRGGSAKIAITASALFGSISGSAVANVASTGVITIPLMKDAGFRPRLAGAVESVASTGGQLMPPVMGAAAFLMAELLQVGYDKVVLAALIPALIYFLAVFIQVDLIAARDGVEPVPAEQIPRGREVLWAGWYFLIPFAVLIGALFWWGFRPGEAAFWATVSVLPFGLVLRYRGQRLRFSDLWTCLVQSGGIVVDIVLIAAAAGLIIGVLNITSLGFALTLSLIGFAGGSLILLLILSAVLSIVLGMGMPTVGVYILLATLIAPTLIELGVEPMAAHLFVMYFGMMSMITPPVAIAAFTASVIAKAKPIPTALTAVGLGWTAYVVPFVFVFEPAILFSTDWPGISLATLRLGLGVWIISACLVGLMFRPLSTLKRLGYAVIGLGVILPATVLPGGAAALWGTLALAVLCVVFEAMIEGNHRSAPVKRTLDGEGNE